MTTARHEQRKRANLGLAGRLLLMVAGSFAFGYALVPLYDIFCQVTGIGTREQLLTAAAVSEGGPDLGRGGCVSQPGPAPGEGAEGGRA